MQPFVKRCDAWKSSSTAEAAATVGHVRWSESMPGQICVARNVVSCAPGRLNERLLLTLDGCTRGPRLLVTRLGNRPLESLF